MKRKTDTAFIDDERVHPDVLWTSRKIQEELNKKSSVDHTHKKLLISQIPKGGVTQHEKSLKIDVSQIRNLKFPETPWEGIKVLVERVCAALIQGKAEKDHSHPFVPHKHALQDLPEIHPTREDIQRFQEDLYIRWENLQGVPDLASLKALNELREEFWRRGEELDRRMKRIEERVRMLEGRMDVTETVRFR